MILRVDNELTFEEISEICDCPLSTVLSRMRYAIQKLRLWMGVEDSPEATTPASTSSRR